MTGKIPYALQNRSDAHGKPWVHTIELRVRQGKFCLDREFSVASDLDRAGHDRKFCRS